MAFVVEGFVVKAEPEPPPGYVVDVPPGYVVDVPPGYVVDVPPG